MKKIQITAMTASDIEALLKSKEEFRIASRLISILSLAKGESSRKAQELLLLSHNQILIWAKRFNEQGLDGLKDKPKSGRKSKITSEQLSILRKIITKESPTKYGYESKTWTAKILVDMIENQFNITYSDDMVYVILKKKLGLTYKRGKGYSLTSKSDNEKKI